MGSKRDYDQVEPPGPLRDGGAKRRKQHRNRPAPANDGSSGLSGQSLNELKKRARDIQRRFHKVDNMPADIQRNLERELAHCTAQIDDLGHKKRRSDMIRKYHQVRFYERQKAGRLRKQLRKRLDKADDGDEKTEVQQQLHIADVDWHYTKYFPFLERYVALYPATKTSGTAADEADEAGVPTAERALLAERPPMWQEIEAAMEEGQRALDVIQERTSERTGPAKIQSRSGAVAKKANGEGDKTEGKGKGKKERRGKKEKEKRGKMSKLPETKEKDTAAQTGEQAWQKREKRQQAKEGEEDGLGFFNM